MVPFYSTVAQFVDASGRILSPFLEYLQQFTIAPPSFIPVTVGTSPFSYEAKEPGHLFITGGTVTDISLIRGSDTITVFPNTVNPRLVPVAVNDIVKTIWAIKPTMKFIPSYGQNTNT